MSTTITEKQTEKKYLTLIGVLSVAIPVVVAILLFMPQRLELGSSWVYFLPHLNGIINSVTAVALIAGFYFIKKGQADYHRLSMTVAFALGCVFLVGYVIYHASVEPTPFGGEGFIRTVYFTILISHIVLAAIVVPFVLFAFYYAWTKNFAKHKKVVKFTLPIWLYVSITGVIAYLMISPYYIY